MSIFQGKIDSSRPKSQNEGPGQRMFEGQDASSHHTESFPAVSRLGPTG